MSTDVKFDFDGALPLARKLWQLADDIRTLKTGRASLATTALTTWKGKFADDFTQWQSDEESALDTCETQLRSAAEAWGESYAKAVNEQNMVLYTRKVAEIKKAQDDRNLLEDAGHALGSALGLNDGDKLPKDPSGHPCPVPRGPGFAKPDAGPKLIW